MMSSSRRRTDAANRFTERRQREDEAPRLREVVPDLATLRLDIAEGTGLTNVAPKHSRIVVVDGAPALFMLPCVDPACKGGGHDLTHPIVSGLKRGQTSFDLEDRCYGSTGSAECGRTMTVKITATYR
jgi:hypothetical protein